MLFWSCPTVATSWEHKMQVASHSGRTARYIPAGRRQGHLSGNAGPLTPARRLPMTSGGSLTFAWHARSSYMTGHDNCISAHRPKRQRRRKAQPALTGPAIVTVARKRGPKQPAERAVDPEEAARVREWFARNLRPPGT
jgi:hypothetical protein